MCWRGVGTPHVKAMVRFIELRVKYHHRRKKNSRTLLLNWFSVRRGAIK